ncbi:MAG: 3-isopropylmalate dehydratase large subunit [Candidatus Electryonea clarkiae]|nr:3-isopropylmalate dehydratase large subunit [Candidatus Electryonea clarkiae]MDP8286426.1 3-isopropylmalate dehydratase large subunit [Candidatus Electryonea clarkiae]
MAMTIAEKIFAAHSGKESVKPGDLIFAKLDRILGTDVTCSLSIKVFEEMGVEKVHNPDQLVLVNDHFVPAKDIKAAQLSKNMREFGQQQGVKNYFEVGRSGICHTVLPENGLAKPGDLIVGADSHTCTYGAVGAVASGIGSTDMAAAWAIGELWFRVPSTIRVEITGDLQEWVGAKDVILYIISQLGVEGAIYKILEFHGSTIENMSMDGRFTIANMAVEAGAKSGVIPADDTTLAFMDQVGVKDAQPIEADPDAEYEKIIEIDVSELKPQVAKPYLPSNAVDVDEVAGTRIDQVAIGSCTNGRIEDFEMAYRILKGKKIHPLVRVVIMPSSDKIYAELIDNGFAREFVAAGATIAPSTCGLCIGGHMGVLAEDEVGLYTTNRNFVGRNGHPSSQVFLSGPAVAAASAIAGEIVSPK